jgi:TP901 family phage tail tape measure protein
MDEQTNAYIFRYKMEQEGAQQVVTELKKLNQTTEEVSNRLKGLGKAQGETKTATDKSIMSLSDFTKAMRRAVIVAPVWYVMRSAMMAFFGALQEGMTYMIEWEYQMAQIRVVSNSSLSEIQALSTGLMELAKNLGVSYKDLGEGAKLWAQQGRAIGEIVPLMESTIKLSMLSGRSITESVEDLTAVMKAFGIEASNTMKIVDTLENVELKHAITVQTLSGALRNSASIAEQMGISFEKLTGIITATHVVTRSSGEKVGNAWKTIFSRMATSGTEAISKMADIPVFLDEAGKESKNQTLNFRNLGDILTELALKWDTLTKAEQNNLADKIAGKRQINEFLAFMGNYKESLKAEADALFSVGKANQAVSILQGTLKIRTEALKNSWVSFVGTVANTDVYKDAVSGFSIMLDYFSNRIDKAGAKYKESMKEINKTISDAQADLSKVEGVQTLTENLKNFNEILNRTQSEEAQRMSAYMAEVYRQSLAIAGIKISPDVKNTVELYDELSKMLPEMYQRQIKSLQQVREANLKSTIESSLTNFEKELRRTKKAIPATLSTELKLGDLGLAGADKLIERTMDKLRSGIALTEEEWTNLKRAFSTDQGLFAIKEHLDISSVVKLYEVLIKDMGELEKFREEGTKDVEAQLKAENERKKAQNAIVSGAISEDTVKEKILEIELAGELAGKSRKKILEEILDLLNKTKIIETETSDTIDDRYQKELSKLKAKQKEELLDAQQELDLQKLSRLGYSNLQIEIQRLAYIKQRAEVSGDELEVQKQIYKIQGMINDEMNEFAKTLQGSVKDAFSEILSGEGDVTSFFSKIADTWKSTLIDTASESLSNSFMQITGAGEPFGKIFGGIKNFGSPISKAFYEGSTMTYNAIVSAFSQGATSVQAGAIPTLRGGAGGGMMGGLGMFGGLFGGGGRMVSTGYQNVGGQGFVQAYSPNFIGGKASGGGGFQIPFLSGLGKSAGSFWGGQSYGQVGMSGVMGAIGGGAMSGNWLGAGLSGVGAMLMGTPLAPLGIATMIGSLFTGKKKKSTSESSWQAQQAPETLPLNVITGGAPLPTAYPLPSSRYFAGQKPTNQQSNNITINIEKIEGTNEDVASQIADKVSEIYSRQLGRGLNILYP